MHIRLWGRVYSLSKKKCILYSILLLIICGIIGYIPIRISMQSNSSSYNNLPQVTYYLPKETINPSSNDNIQPTNELIAVHIIGCITNPGVYYLSYGSLLIDIVNQAGGFTPDADIAAPNLAYRLSAGMQIRIPSLSDTDKTWLISEGTSTSNSTNKADSQHKAKVNINTASLDELMTLSGIGESSAKSIIAYREEHGNFRDIKDIMDVPGIKEGKFNKIKDDICISS